MSLLAACGSGGDGGGGGPVVEAPKLLSIQIAPATITKAVGLTQQYTATGTFTTGPTQDITASVVWASSSPTTATINASGLATTKAVGSATIKASLGDISSPAATLTVNGATLRSISISPAGASKAAGLTQQFTATGTFDVGPTQDLTSSVTWTSSDITKVTINAAGLATTKAAGASSISASRNGVNSNVQTLTVTAATLVSIAVTPAAVSRPLGLTQQYKATGTYSDGTTPDITTNPTVTWLSSDTSKATINAAGLATTVAAGVTNITASLSPVTSSAVTLTVTGPALVSIQVTPATASDAAGFSRQFTAIGTFASGPPQDVTTSASWASSTAAATIGVNTGLAKAVSVGTPSITATLNSISSNAATFTVTAVTQWTAAASLATGRRFHTATALVDGTVLMAGGNVTNSTRTATSETYVTDAFTTRGNMGTARGLHTATRLGNGTVLVVGGDDGTNALLSNELYAPSTNVWTAATSMVTARTKHTATLLPDGKVLVIGGVTGTTVAGASTATAEIYNPAGAGTWTPAASMTIGRSAHTATLLANGKVVVIGGESAQGKRASIEIYDPALNTWTTPSAVLATGRSDHVATVLADGKVLVTGGFNSTSAPITESQLYDPTAGTFGSAASLATGRVFHSATLLNGRVLVTGGFGGAGLVGSSEVYDPATNGWVLTGALANPRAAHTATLLSTGRILVTGGLDVGGASASSITSELY
ncbi:MAG: hypothetical protein HHJ18_14255 [Polaromonas sp.]|nr:hypothetical protein [Polaromonas sp.]